MNSVNVKKLFRYDQIKTSDHSDKNNKHAFWIKKHVRVFFYLKRPTYFLVHKQSLQFFHWGHWVSENNQGYFFINNLFYYAK